MTLTSGGNLLVGTTTDAGFKLDVNGTGRFSNILVANSDIHQVSTGGLYWGAASTYVIGVTGNTANGNLSFITGSTVKATITSSGNVGIGTSSPGFILDVHTNNSVYNTRFYQPSSSTSAYNALLITGAMTSAIGYMGIGGSATGNTSFRDTFVVGTQSNNALVLNTNDSERMRITSGGNVLIGTTSDAGYRLEVAGVIRANGGQIIVNNVANNWLQSNQNGTSAQFQTWFASNGTTRRGYFGYPSGSSDNFTLMNEANGQMAFGTNSSTALILASTGAATFSSLGTGTVYSNGGTLTNTNPSDLNLKINVTPINYGLDDILKLNPVSFHWKNDKINQGKQYGFIAQEVQKIMPDLVKQGEYLGLDKEAIFTTLVKAIQELKKEIDTLKN
jgi:hypothetical protein